MDPYQFERRFVTDNDRPWQHNYGTDPLFPYNTGPVHQLMSKRTAVTKKITDWTPSFFGSRNTPSKMPWDTRGLNSYAKYWY
jgi:hypothetical protein